MEYVEHTSIVLYKLVRANSNTRALKISLSAIIADFITHDFIQTREVFARVVSFLKSNFKSDCACTKMSKTLQSYETYSIFYLSKTCSK